LYLRKTAGGFQTLATNNGSKFAPLRVEMIEVFGKIVCAVVQVLFFLPASAAV
jgi:hypothetical protein